MRCGDGFRINLKDGFLRYSFALLHFALVYSVLLSELPHRLVKYVSLRSP